MLEISFINVGYGESILIRMPEKSFVMLIDVGSNMDTEYSGESGRIRTLDFLQKIGVDAIDILVFSHIHEDHTCGLLPVLEAIPVKQFWASIELSPEYYGKEMPIPEDFSEANRLALTSFNTWSRLMTKLPKEQLRFIHGVEPHFFTFEDLSIDLLGPETLYLHETEAALDLVFTAKNEQKLLEYVENATGMMNNASLIFRLNYHGKSVLLCGDTNRDGFVHLLNGHRELLRADIQKIGHHGQADAVSPELEAAVKPDTVICCASNDFRHNSSNITTFQTIRDAFPGKPIQYCFQDAVYLPPFAEDPSPRDGITLTIP